MKMISFLEFLCTAFSISLLLQTASANTYYVGASGKADFSTIQAVADIVNPGDTVIVRNGIYTRVAINRSGTENNWIVFKSENKWGAVLDGNSNSESHGWSFNGNSSYIRVENFEIRDFSAGGFHSNASAHHIYIKGNHVHHIGRICSSDQYGKDGMYIGGKSGYITLDGNVWHDVGRLENGEKGCQNTNQYFQNHDHGLYINASHIIVINNIFYNFFRGWAIHIYGNNVKDDIKIINNTFAFPNPYRRGHIISYGTNVLVQNNIFYKPQEDAFSNAEGVTSRNNIIDLKGDQGLMKDPDKLDFHLISGSRAIDAGIQDGSPDFDYEGNSRPQNSGVDIGAYEFKPLK